MKNGKKILASAIAIALNVTAHGAVLNFNNVNQAYSAASDPISSNSQWFGPALSSGNTVRRNEIYINAHFTDGLVVGGFTKSSVNVTDNELTIAEGIGIGNAVGGFNANASAMYNTVTVKGSAQNVLGGYTTARGYARGNSVEIESDAHINENVIGGYAAAALADSNDVSIAGEVSGNVYGGYGESGAQSNYLEISGIVEKDAFAGFAQNGDVLYNGITLSQRAQVSQQIYGGYTQNGSASSNFITVNSGASANGVVGGYSANGTVEYNTVDVWGNVTESVVGDGSKQGQVLNNSVSVNAGKVGDVYGAYTENGAAQSNSVTIVSGATAQNVTGGYTVSGDALYNTVEVAGKGGNIIGGKSKDGKALNNSVTVNTGTIDSVVAGAGSTQAFGNQLRVKKDATVNGNACAGYSAGSASYNYMEFSGHAQNVAGGYSNNGKADFNYVNVLDGAHVHDIYGGKGAESAAHNTLLVRNAQVSGNIYGGYGEKATANIVILSGEMKLDSTDVYGGFYGNTAVNAQNVISAEGNVSVKGIDGFKVLKLTVNENNIKVDHEEGNIGQNQYILKVAEDINLNDKTLVVASHKVDPGQDIALLWSDKEIHTNENTVVEGDSTFVFKRWTSLEDHNYEHELGVEDIQNPEYFVEETVISADARTLSKTALGSLALIKHGADFVMEEVKNAARYALGPDDFAMYIAASGGYSNYDGDSDFSLRDYHLAVGGAFSRDNLMWSVFAQTGYGDMGLKESAAADADISYAGLGAIVDYSFDNGMYADASLSLGYIKTDFDAVYEEDTADFTARAFYGSVQTQGGYRFAVNDFTDADIYVRYLGLYETPDRFNLHDKGNSRMSVDPRFAHAVRAGADFAFKFNSFASFTAGLACEHIFDSSVHTFVNGYSLDEENIDGTSYLGSIGIDLISELYPDFSLSSDIIALAGDREGVMFSLVATQKF